jgi:predicted dehydrogenase/sugar phosphate isomerase/epimerase
MHTLSFMSANFVARQIGYHMSKGWMQGDDATNAWFSPLETFEARFSEMLGEVAALGFEAIDLWTAHIHWKWATPAHLDTASRLLAKHKLRPVSYAGGFGATPAEFRAACLVCARLGIPVLGGGLPLLAKDRPAAVALLREFGLVYAIENHPEKSPAELLAKLGEGDEDVIGVAIDTGWFGTQSCDALSALTTLAPRLKHVHLKDVKARRAAPTGFMFIDMGHETCALGDGIVPVEACARKLVELGYRGAIAIEHEPEEFDPREDVRLSRTRVVEWLQSGLLSVTPKDRVGVAIVGCGNIAAAYARQIATYPHVRLIGSQDIDRARSEKLAADFGGKVYDSLDDVLADPAVEIVVNLTIHHAHVEVVTRCLEAGKHVHTEKPLAMTHADARRLVELADTRKLRLSCAPTTWLGEAQQTAWKMVRDGRIGTPRVAYAEVNWGRIESWHPNPGPFYDVGPVYDVAVYPLTLLTTWFGPARRVTAAGGVVYPNRRTKEGVPFSITTPEWSVAAVELESGVIARVTSSFYVGWNSRQKGLEVHGDTAMIGLDRWDVFDSALWFAELGQRENAQRIVPLRPPATGIEFARGLSDLAEALREGRPHRTTGAHAAHVVEIMEAVHTSLREGRAIPVTSSFTAPAPFAWA